MARKRNPTGTDINHAIFLLESNLALCSPTPALPMSTIICPRKCLGHPFAMHNASRGGLPIMCATKVGKTESQAIESYSREIRNQMQ